MKLKSLERLRNKVWISWSAISHMFDNKLLSNDTIDESFENILEKLDDVEKEVEKVLKNGVKK